MLTQTQDEVSNEAQISQRHWIKVLWMLHQNWCVIEGDRGDAVELVLFVDRGDVFDHLSAANLHAAQALWQANDFLWMIEHSSFYEASGVPTMPCSGVRDQSRPVYSNGAFWNVQPECCRQN